MEALELGAQRAKKVTAKDVQLAYLVGGIPGVEKLLAGHPRADFLIRKALTALKAVDVLPAATLAALEDYVFRLPVGKRGRPPPKVGGTRSYSVARGVRENRKDDLYVRLPVRVLGVEKGDIIEASFEADCIVVRRKKATP